jgi:Domain of unknown function (DUF4124)
MTRKTTHALLCLVAAALCAGGAHAATQRDANSKQQVYKWVDEKGVVHYGDAVPPQYADQDKTILNSQGVPVGSIPGKRTPEQAAAEAAQHKTEEHARETALQNRQRDQNLLATYLSVEEIEALRDRRAEILDAQARVTSQYLDQLRGRQKQLEQQAQHFKPYNTSPNAPQLPERLAEDLVRTTTDIATQQRNLEVKRQELEKLRAQFASDIVRFKELKRIETDYNGGATTRN